MASFWGRLLDALAVPAPSNGSRLTKAPVVAGPTTTKSRVVVGPVKRTVIAPTPAPVVEKVRRPTWDEQEWVRTVENVGTVYTGQFRARQNGRLRLFDGRIVQGKRELAAYIADPPPEIRRHPKGPCFSLTKGNWFRVHWHRAPEDPDNAILYVETILNESLNG